MHETGILLRQTRGRYNLALNIWAADEAGDLESEEFDMSWKSKLVLGILTALAMFALTFTLPRQNAVQITQLVQFPLTVGVWAIFVLLFVKLK